MKRRYDVIVVGAGNAAFSAAHAAREQGASVLILEKAPREWIGGNSYFTAGAFRTTYAGLEELRPLLDEVDDDRAALTELPPYMPIDFEMDMERLTEGECDGQLTNILVDEVADVIRWLHSKGLRFRLMYDRQSYKVNGKWRFWGGLVLGTVGGGRGLIEQHLAAAERAGVGITCDSPVVGLLQDADGTVTGVIRDREDVEASSVILAAGGFEANASMRVEHLGPEWRAAKVRGTPYNTGTVLSAALEAGAQPYGQWSGCHSIAWDAAAPATGDLSMTHLFSKQSYLLGIVVNRYAERFFDEGEDFRNYTYAKYGAEILKQPGAIAYQIFDAKTEPLLRQDEYNAPGVSRYEANSVRELAEKINIPTEALESTVRDFNAAVQPGDFNPTVKDGKGTAGIEPLKSNWALPLDTPPYLAFAVACGISFTFGGLRIDGEGHVLDSEGYGIPGLYAAGELVGGLFYHNYPGGSGLSAGAVFGRRAGKSAARSALNREKSRK